MFDPKEEYGHARLQYMDCSLHVCLFLTSAGNAEKMKSKLLFAVCVVFALGE